MDGFLPDAEDFTLGAWWHGTVGAVEAEGSFHSVSVGVLGNAAELDGQGVLTGVLRAKCPDGLARIGEALAHVLACCIEMTCCSFVFVLPEEFGEDFELDRDADIALGEGVVDFAGDAIALGKDGAEFTLGAEETQSEGKKYEGSGEGEEEQIEPDGLVEVRAELERERRALRVPDPVIVGGLEAEGVVAGGDVGVVGGTARAGFGPLMIEAFEYVSVVDFLRGGEAEASVIELEMVVAGGNFERIDAQGLVDVVDSEACEGDGRRGRIDGEVRRIDLDESFGGGEPEEAVAGAPCGGVAIGGHLARAEAVGGAEFHPIGAAAFHVAITPGDAAGGCKPEMFLIVLKDGMNGGLTEASVRNRGEVLPVPEIPAMVLCTDEEGAVGAREKGGDDVA